MEIEVIAVTLGKVLLIILSLTVFTLLLGVISLWMVNLSRWIFLRIHRAAKKPAEKILAPTRLTKLLKKKVNYPDQMQKPELVKEKKIKTMKA